MARRRVPVREPEFRLASATDPRLPSNLHWVDRACWAGRDPGERRRRAEIRRIGTSTRSSVRNMEKQVARERLLEMRIASKGMMAAGLCSIELHLDKNTGGGFLIRQRVLGNAHYQKGD